MVFIGLDLAWSPRNRTGAAVLCDNRLLAHTGVLGSNDEIFAFVAPYLQGAASAVIAVDAPLRVPNVLGRRPCDQALSAEWRRFEAGALPANRQLLAFQGEVRGETLVAHLAQQYGFVESAPLPHQAQGRYICEIFPHSAHVHFFGLAKTLKYKARPGRTHDKRLAEFARYQQLLATLQQATPPLLGTANVLALDLQKLRGRTLKAYEDTLDAITCAYTASYLWHHGPTLTSVYGTIAEGHILTPLPPGDFAKHSQR
jgi:predicted RNase H-like nuclease